MEPRMQAMQVMFMASEKQAETESSSSQLKLKNRQTNKQSGRTEKREREKLDENKHLQYRAGPS